jgi:AcrR family transcriptional regulator
MTAPATQTVTGRRRGPYRKTRKVRERILEAGLEVFAQSGYRNGSLREIAERVDMSEAGLLHHFPSKSALLLALLEHRDARSRELVDLESETGLETLAGLVRLARYNADRPGVVELYCVLSAEATSPSHPAHEYFVERYRSMRQSIGATLEEVRRAGYLHDGVDPYRAACRLVAIWDGLQVQWLLDRESLDMADDLADYLHRILTVRLPGI